MRWDEYFARRIAVLAAMKKLFAETESLAQLERDESKAIATLKKIEPRPKYLNQSLKQPLFGLFGNVA